MFNRVCCPEFSFNMSEDSPHALVAFTDGQKDMLPVSFIKKFPSNWREKKWNMDYLFRVFWSPDDDDSPTEMLKRVAEIPEFEPGESFEKPGYYRGAVVAVEGTGMI